MRKLFTLNIGVATFSLLAAVFWFLTALVPIPEIDQKAMGLTVNPASEFNAAMHLASRWNSWAAGCACVAALLLAIASFLNAKR